MGRDIIVLNNMLEELDNPQPIIQVFIYNTMTSVIADNTLKRQHSRAMNMKYFGIRDQKTL